MRRGRRLRVRVSSAFQRVDDSLVSEGQTRAAFVAVEKSYCRQVTSDRACFQTLFLAGSELRTPGNKPSGDLRLPLTAMGPEDPQSWNPS